MDATLQFRRILARRVVRLISLAALPASLVTGCGSSVDTNPSDGHGDQGSGGQGSGGSASGGAGGIGQPSGGNGSGGIANGGAGAGGAPAAVKECIDAPGAHDAATCPSSDEAMSQLTPVGCGISSVSAPTFENGQCCYMVEGISNCSTGRPYLVGERALHAEGTEASAWATYGMTPMVDGLSLELREQLARAWTDDALMEHASVASFGRFGLELMAVGAPAELLAAAHRAALDEIEHARLCFALASAYAGSAIGPSAFPFGGKVDVAADLAGIAASTVREGCIGETLASILAAEQLGRATDPAVRAVLAKIAEDEARHAELAWRTVAWALAQGGADVRRAVVEAFGSAGAIAAAFAGSPDDAEDFAIEPFGRLAGHTRAEALRRALADVVLPCMRALLDEKPSSERPMAATV